MSHNTLALRLSAVLVAGLIVSSPFACAGEHVPASKFRYVINGGEVYDKKTDLTWQRCIVGHHWQEGAGCVGADKAFTFEQAQQQGSGQWRVPSKDELASLTHRYSENSIYAVAFPDMDDRNSWYWTSTPEGASGGWSVHFNGGGVDYGGRGALLAVRLVRSGQ